MKKKFLNLFMIVMTIASVSLMASSCGDDDDDNGNPADKTGGNDDKTDTGGSGTQTKHLTAIREVEVDEGEKYEYNVDFSYDSKGNLIRYAETGGDGRYELNIANFSWKAGEMQVTYPEYDESYSVKLNNKGGIISIPEDNVTFSYDKNGCLSKFKKDDEDIVISWANGRILSIDESYSNGSYNWNSSYTFTYSGKTCKGFLPYIFPQMVEDDYIVCYAMPQLMGLVTTQLPSGCKYKDDEEVINISFDYTFTSDGYVASMKAVNHNKDKQTTIKFTWE